MDYKLSLTEIKTPKDVAKLTEAISELADSLDVLYTETAPNSNISGRVGQIAIYNNSSVFTVWICTDGDTTWQQIDVTATVSSQQIIKGWINFNGTGTIAINDSYNVTSITDNGTGDYTVTWDTDFANANYAVVATCIDNGANQARIVSTQVIAVGTVSVVVNDNSDTDQDVSYVGVIAIGDQ